MRRHLVSLATVAICTMSSHLGGSALAQDRCAEDMSPLKSCFSTTDVKLPALRLTKANPPPSCVTPAALARVVGEIYNRKFDEIEKQNRKNKRLYSGGDLDKWLQRIASAYKNAAETDLPIRWDYAFYQMIDETGWLTFYAQNKQGQHEPTRLLPKYNNFAGIGAVDEQKGAFDTFDSIETGVRAHLQHLLVYSGQRVERPLACRTQKSQGQVLACVAKFKAANGNRDVTFADMTTLWSATWKEDEYPQAIARIAERIKTMIGHCD